MKYLILFSLVVSIVAFNSCRKEYDQPPADEIPEGMVLTIQELRDTFNGDPIKFDQDFNLFATVTMDESNGNLYKEVYIQDETGGINLRMITGGGLYEGDSLRINLNGITLNTYNGVYQLDSVNIDKSVVKQANNIVIEPANITLSQVNSTLTSRLVRLNNVEFISSDLGTTLADAQNQQSKNLTLTDCDGNNTLIVRTSGYSDIANDTVPEGNGSMVGILSEFNGDFQIYIRSMEEVDMTGTRCSAGGGGGGGNGYLSKDFSDQDITSGGWSNYTVLGTGFQWETSDLGSQGNYYGLATGYDFGNSTSNATDLWLISPAIDLSAATAPGLTFDNASNYSGPALQLLISTDYDGSSDPTVQGNWTDYTSNATWDTNSNDFDWTNSGIIPMTAFNGESSVYIAFRYTSTSSQTATWEVDDIILEEQ